MKKHLPAITIFAIIIGIIGLAIWFSERDSKIKELVKLDLYPQEELSFLEKEGFLEDLKTETATENKEKALSLLKSPTLIEQDLNSPDEHFEVLATKLNLNQNTYQVAFKLENRSGQNKEFYLIPVSKNSQIQFQEIKGVLNNKKQLSVNKEDARKEPLNELYDVNKHKKELNPELAKAYDDIDNNYQAKPIKITLGAKTTLLAKSQWRINEGQNPANLEPVYFLVYGSAGGAMDDLGNRSNNSNTSGLPEIIEKRGENSKTYDLGKGKYRLVTGGTMHYKDNYNDLSELWKEIDLTFVDGKITKAPYELTTDIPNKSITMKDKKTGKITTIKLDSFSEKNSSSEIPMNNVEPKISENRITWEEIVRGVDLVIEAGDTDVRFQRIIKSKDAVQRARFMIDGSLPIAYQAFDKNNKQLAVSTSKSGKLITEDFEATEDQYPIKIDPTLTVQPSGADNTLLSGSPDNNYGSEACIYVGYSSYVTAEKYRSILRFDFSSLPSGADISSATLSLYYYDYYNNPSGRTYWAYEVTQTAWTEMGSTWNKYDGTNNWSTAGGDYTTTNGASKTVPASFGWMDWTVTTLAQHFQSSHNEIANFLIRDGTEGTNALAYFYSRDEATQTTLRPELVIDYTVYEPSVIFKQNVIFRNNVIFK